MSIARTSVQRGDGVAGPFVIGIDGGTEGVRAAVFDPTGMSLSFARVEYPTVFPRQGWAEQDPEQWWSGAALAVRRAVESAGVAPESIAALCLDGTSCTVVLTDATGRPLRPALLWMDVRASAEAREIAATGDPALKYSGYDKGSAEWLLSKTLWISRHEPDVYAAAQHVCEYTDWMGWRFTGEWASSINTASIRGYYDRDAEGWPSSLIESIGLEGLEDKLAAQVLDMGTPLGGLTREAAEALGLPPGTLVAVGGADAFVGMVGLNVLSPGSCALITGSSHLHLAQADAPAYASGMFGAYTDAVMPGQWTLEGGQVSTGSVVKWFRKICDGGYFNTEALSSDEVYAVLQREAAGVPPGSDGVLALEFWQGNRTPYVDADARGMIWGLSLAHTPAHIYRALLEAVSYGTENVLRTFAAAGHPVTELVACGGATRSPLWMQIHADVCNVPITLTKDPEAVTLGSGVLAAAAAGLFPGVADAAASMVHVDRVVEPDPEAHAAYRFYVDAYLRSYAAMRDLMHDVVRHGDSRRR
jgi:ribulokinase